MATPRGLRLAELGDRGAIRRGQFDQSLRETIERLKIDVVCLDPFVKSHAVEENDNMAIDFVADVLASIAVDMNCAVDAPHHKSKGASDGGDADKSRGASAFINAARLAYTLTQMGEKEADRCGLSQLERRGYVRLDSAKVNIAPPIDKTTWFKIVGVNIGNSTDAYPHGDTVQTVEPWSPPNAWGDLTDAMVTAILDRIDDGLPDGRKYAASYQAPRELWAWPLVLKELPSATEEQARGIIRGWLERGLLKAENHHDPVTHKDRKSLFVDNSKRFGRGIDVNVGSSDY